MEINAEVNSPCTGSSTNIHVAELNWGEPLPSTVPVDEASLILAADCVYFEVSNLEHPFLYLYIADLVSTARVPPPRQDALRSRAGRERHRDPLLLEETTKGDHRPIWPPFSFTSVELTESGQADKRFFILLKKHFDSGAVTDDREGEKERYGREGVSLVRLRRRR